MARLLVVDDDPGVLAAMTRGLVEIGAHDVTVAISVETALGVLRAARAPFALLVLDVLLPDGHGQDIARAAPHVPALFVSGRPGGHLQKPFTGQELVDAVALRLKENGP